MTIARISAIGYFGLSSFLSALPNGSKVLLISSGQSNWEGTPSSNLYTDAPPTKSKWWRNSTGAFEPLVPGQNGYRSQHSPSIHLVKAFEAEYPNLVLHMVEYGSGGNGFEAGAGFFGPGKTGRVTLLAQINNAIANLDAAETPYYLAGFIWNQGEHDMINTTWANGYSAQLSGFLADIRTATDANLPAVLTRININSIYTNPAKATVRAALETLGSAWVNTDDQVMRGDGKHYDPPQYTVIGLRHFEAIKTFEPIERTPVLIAPPGDTVAPVLQSASISASNPARIVLSYNEALDPAFLPAISAYTVAGKTVSARSISGSVVNVDVSVAYTGGQSGTISYTKPGTNALRDAAGNESASFTNQAFTLTVTDTTPPALTSVSTTASTVTLNYNEALDPAFVPAASAFSTAGGRTISAVGVSGAQVSFTISPVLTAGGSDTVSYVKPGTNALRDAAGNESISFTNQPFSLPAGDVPLIFTTRTANISQPAQGGDLTATSPAYATTYALADSKIPAGQDGWFSFDYNTTENRDILIGLNTSATNEQFSGFEYLMWCGGSTGAIRVGRNGSSNDADVGSNAAFGNKFRLGRFGGEVKAQRSQNGGSTWTDLFSVAHPSNPVDASEFFLCVAMNRSVMPNPRVFGGVPR